VTDCVPRLNVIFCTGSDGTAVTATCPFNVAPLAGVLIETERGTFATKAWTAALAEPLVPALFSTEAVNVCVPSVSDVAGVKERNVEPALPVTGCPSRISDALVTLMSVSASLNVIDIVGFELLMNAPLAGVLTVNIGGVVSGETNLLVNMPLCTFPPKETAPLTVTP